MHPSLGQVGRVLQANPALLNLLCGNGYVPVVACMAGDRAGNLYNVNADQMAVACAVGFAADQLLFLTDVEGALDAGKQLRSTLTAAQAGELIAEGVATGGMQAKLNAAIAALQAGVKQVRIVNGAAAGIVQRVLAGEKIGTRMILGESV